MENQQTTDQTRVQAFAGKVLNDVTSTIATVMASIGDRLGLFRQLAQAPATSAELAERAHIDERYAREWLQEMASAGYLEYDPLNCRFALSPEHALVLTQEGGPFFLAGAYQLLIAEIGQYQQLIKAFQQGGGVPLDAFDSELWEGQARFSAGFFEHLLVPVWVPAMPELQKKLEQGARVADIGCGYGKALIKLAQSYPRSRFVGYDVFAPATAKATAKAKAAGVGDRVRFETLDASEGLPEKYDAIMTFDVVHDAINPGKLVRTIHEALKPEGHYLCMEASGSDKPEENAGMVGALFYGISVLYCLTISLAGHGEGLGTLGLPEPKLRALCTQVGFRDIRRVPVEIPFNNLYEIRP